MCVNATWTRPRTCYSGGSFRARHVLCRVHLGGRCHRNAPPTQVRSQFGRAVGGTMSPSGRLVVRTQVLGASCVPTARDGTTSTSVEGGGRASVATVHICQVVGLTRTQSVKCSATRAQRKSSSLRNTPRTRSSTLGSKRTLSPVVTKRWCARAAAVSRSVRASRSDLVSDTVT